jgi:hypothetical protein
LSGFKIDLLVGADAPQGVDAPQGADALQSADAPQGANSPQGPLPPVPLVPLFHSQIKNKISQFFSNCCFNFGLEFWTFELCKQIRVDKKRNFRNI